MLDKLNQAIQMLSSNDFFSPDIDEVAPEGKKRKNQIGCLLNNPEFRSGP
jgi:hypothetical protein